MALTPLVTTTKDYIVVKIPRNMADFHSTSLAIKKKKEMTEDALLRIAEKGEKEYREGKIKVADSILDLLSS